MRYPKICLLVVAVACSALGADERITVGGGEFPATVGGAPWVQVTNDAAEGGPGGVGVSYRASRVKVDIYLFDAGDPSWVGKSLDERFVLETANIPGVLKEIERRGIYADVKIGPADDASAGALTFTHLQASYAEKGEKKKSHYYLARYRGRLLKIRITAINAVEDEIIGRVFAEAATLFGKTG